MKYLVDSNVLSETTKPAPANEVVEWLRTHDDESVVNPIVLGELEFGILLLPPGRRRKRLLEWLADGVRTLEVVAIDAATSTIWAKLVSDLRRKGRAMPLGDSLIAASAKQYHLTVVTRNVDDYRHAGVSVIDPFEAA